jgi:hypothetical protein
MPVTCGSVGDIIAVGLLIKDLVTALNESRGSQAEYKQLVDKLSLLQDVLARIDALCNTAGATTGRRSEVEDLHNDTLRIAQECRKCIESFSLTLKKYGKTLGSSAGRKKGEMIMTSMASLQWLGEKKDVVKFHAEIARQTTSLIMMLVATAWYDHKT